MPTRYVLLLSLLSIVTIGILLKYESPGQQVIVDGATDFIEIQDLQTYHLSDFRHVTLQDTSQIVPRTYSRDNFAWVASQQLGDEIIFVLNGIEEGEYDLDIWLAGSGDFGIVDIKLNGDVVAEKVDLYSGVFNHAAPTRVSDVFLMESNQLSFQVVGSNSATTAPHYQMGFDGLIIKQ